MKIGTNLLLLLCDESNIQKVDGTNYKCLSFYHPPPPSPFIHLEYFEAILHSQQKPFAEMLPTRIIGVLFFILMVFATLTLFFGRTFVLVKMPFVVFLLYRIVWSII